MSGLGPPSAPGVILAGFDYQFGFAWYQALALLRDDDPVHRVTVELKGAGNVDDVVVEALGRPTVFHQVKYAVDNSRPLSSAYFTDVPRGSVRSVLQKFRDSLRTLTTDGVAPEMVLQTNRMIDSGDPLLALLDGRDGKLVPRITAHGPNSAVGVLRREWAEHLEVGEPELLHLLGRLAVHAGSGPLDQLRETSGELMRSRGLRGRPADVDRAVSAIRRRVIDGQHVLDTEVLRDLIAAEGLERSAPRSSLLIQAIDRRPWPEAATASVDWVDLFEGEEPRARRALRDGADWNGRLRPELQQAVRRLRAAGCPDVRVEGALRLSTWFLAGVELGGVAGFRASMVDPFGKVWGDAEGGKEEPFELKVTEERVGTGEDLAVGLSVTGSLRADVLSYLQGADLPVGRLVELVPAAGTGRTALSPGTATAWAEAALAAIKREATNRTVHLFMYAPAGAMLLLGRIYNRVPTTQLYDDLNRAPGYTPTFCLPA